MQIEGTDEVQALIDQGNEANEAMPAAEVPAAEMAADAVAADEGRGIAEAQWLEQISKHLHHIEGRLMEEGFLGHEVVRQIGILLEAMSPPPRGDWGWFVRRCQDIAVRTLRQLIAKYGNRSAEPLGNFEVRAMHIVRLYIEEAVHRHLLGLETPMGKAGACSFMLTMRNIEENTIPQDAKTLGIFTTFTEANLRDLALRMARGETTTVEHMPSYAEAMRNMDMKHEVFSLIPVRVEPRLIAMTRAEVRAMIEASGRPLRAEARVPGHAGPSAFGHIFGA